MLAIFRSSSAQASNDIIRTLVNPAHHLDLMALLQYILLVDADGVNPYPTTLIVMAQLFDDASQVPLNHKFMAIEVKIDELDGTAPHP